MLFDCDGALVDSEPIINGVLRDMLEELGWKLSRQECMRIFVGKAVKDEAALVEARTGQPLTEDWLVRFREGRNLGLIAGVKPMRGAVAAVAQIHETYQGRIACASGADRFKVELQLEKSGLMPYFKGRIFSGHELPRSKPAPDVYLAAAAALGVDPCSPAGLRPHYANLQLAPRRRDLLRERCWHAVSRPGAMTRSGRSTHPLVTKQTGLFRGL